MKKNLALLSTLMVTVLISLHGCSLNVYNTEGSERATTVVRKATPEEEMAFAKLYSAVWMQRATEYKALCIQAYNLAGKVLEEEVAKPENKNVKLAIITDIDETFLDNSPNAVYQSLRKKGFSPKEWSNWVSMAKADTLPGSLAFFKKAAALGVQVFYISNRDEADLEPTIANLRKYDFPFADKEHVMLKGNTSNKDARRLQVLNNHKVIIYLGDNMTDFSSAFKVEEKQRDAELYKIKDEIGKRFIVLPNPNYGDWEGSFFKFKSLTPEQQVKEYKQKAVTY